MTEQPRERSQHQDDHDEVLLRLRAHPRALVLPLVVLLLVLGLAGFGAAVLPDGDYQTPGRVAIGVVAALLVLRFAVVPWLRWFTTTCVLTPDRLTINEGIVRHRTRGVPLSRLADVAVERSLLQRLLGSGDLVLDTVGERAGLTVRDVPRAKRIAERIADLVEERPESV